MQPYARIVYAIHVSTMHMLKRGGGEKNSTHNPILCQSAFRGEGQSGGAKGTFLSLGALECVRHHVGGPPLAAVLGQGVGTVVLVAG